MSSLSKVRRPGSFNVFNASVWTRNKLVSLTPTQLKINSTRFELWAEMAAETETLFLFAKLSPNPNFS